MSSYKLKIASIVGRVGIPTVFDLLYKRPKILFYHGVEETIQDSKIQGNQMLFSVFKKQIYYLKKKYTIISIDDFFNRYTNKSLKGDEIVITFDDGYRNNYTIVAPFLKSLDIPFTVFVCPQLIEAASRVPTFYIRSSVYCDSIKVLNISSWNKRFEFTDYTDRERAESFLINYVKTSSNEDVLKVLADIKSSIGERVVATLEKKYNSEELMTWNEVKDITQFGATIGSHSLDHAILHGNQLESEIIRQLDTSQKIICSTLGTCDYVAFPNGDYNSVCDYTLSSVNKFYKLGFAANGKSLHNNDNPNYISRIGICGDYHAFKSQISILGNI